MCEEGPFEFPEAMHYVSENNTGSARSHTLTWLSSEATESTDSSVGCHATEVMGAVCHLKWPTGESLLKFLRSQTLKEPSCG